MMKVTIYFVMGMSLKNLSTLIKLLQLGPKDRHLFFDQYNCKFVIMKNTGHENIFTNVLKSLFDLIENKKMVSFLLFF